MAIRLSSDLSGSMPGAPQEDPAIKKNPGAGDKVTMFFTSSMCFFVGFSKSTGLS